MAGIYHHLKPSHIGIGIRRQEYFGGQYNHVAFQDYVVVKDYQRK